MAIRNIKRNFSGGEVALTIASRDDLAKYQASCYRMQNFIAQLHGGARFRPGLGFIDVAEGPTCLVPFEFNTDEEDKYVMVFTDQSLRFVQGDGYVITAATITDISQADPCVVTCEDGHRFIDGQTIYIDDVEGMTELNEGYYIVANATDTTFELSGVDSTLYTAYSTGGEVIGIYTIGTPYVEADLRGIVAGYAQLGDTVYLAHPNYSPYRLVRYDHDNWSFESIDFENVVPQPVDAEVTWYGQGSGSYTQTYTITAVNDEGVESLPIDDVECTNAYPAEEWVAGDEIVIEFVPIYDGTAYEYNIYKDSAGYMGLCGVVPDDLEVYAITGATQANPCVITCAAGHGFSNGRKITIGYVEGMEELNGNTYTVANAAATTFQLSGVDSTGYTAYESGGEAVGSCFFYDENYDPDTGNTPPSDNNPFEDDNDPGVCAFHQQRLWFGGSNDNPNVLYASRTGDFENFGKSFPLKDDDSLEFVLASNSVNQIKWMTPFNDLMVGTTGTEFRVNGGDSESITPIGVSARVQSAWGSMGLRPLVVGNSILHVQRQGSTVRDLFYSLEKDGYAGNDLSVLATQLFDGYSLVAWAYQQVPDSIVWAVRSDGALLGMTYLKEHEIWGWHIHTTDGYFEDVCVIGGDDEDQVYVTVSREIDGSTEYYIERLQPKWREIDGLEYAVYLDSALTYDGWNTEETYGLTLSGGSTWGSKEAVTLTATGHTPFETESVGEYYELRSGDDVVLIMVTAYTSDTVVTAKLMSDAPTSLQGTVTYDWVHLVTTLYGLDHLEGKEVSVLADGSPESGLLVSSGAIAMSNRAGVVQVGLPYEGVLTPLPIELDSEGGTTQGSPKSFGQVQLRLYESAAGKVATGPLQEDEDELTFDDILYAPETWGAQNEPFTGVRAISSSGGADAELAVHVKQDKPLPLNILSLIVEVDFGQG